MKNASSSYFSPSLPLSTSVVPLFLIPKNRHYFTASFIFQALNGAS
jgi:hypothetical protein